MTSKPDAQLPPDGHGPGLGAGYGRPPVRSRFKKGQSGNPHGRPPKLRASVGAIPLDTAELILSECNRTVTITENGERKDMPAIQALTRKTVLSAMSAPLREQLRLMRFSDYLDQRVRREKEAQAADASARKRAYEVDRYRKLGKPAPDVVPHPADIVVNERAREIIYNGPVNEIEKAKWDAAFTFLTNAKVELQLLQAEQSDGLCYEKYIRQLRREIAFIERTYPAEAERRIPGFNLGLWRKQQENKQRAQRSRKQIADR